MSASDVDAFLSGRTPPGGAHGMGHLGTLNKTGRKLLCLGRQWLVSLVPFALAKVNRVSYGLRWRAAP